MVLYQEPGGGAIPGVLRWDSWSWGPSHREKKKVDIIEEELQKLMRRGLDGVRVFHTLYHHRVAPLAERARSMWRYGGPSDPDRASSEDLPDDEVWSRLGRVLQLKPKERVAGKPVPFNSSIVSTLVCSLLFSPHFFLYFSYIFFDWDPHVPQGLGNYKSQTHLPKGPEGVAWHATQKEAADTRKKKKAEVAHQKYKKEKEVARRVKAGERKSDVESKLESEDPMDVDDMVFSKEEESREVVVTSVERRDPKAMFAGDE